jgi:hypothetical protein
VFRESLHRIHQALIWGRQWRAPRTTPTGQWPGARLTIEGLEDRCVPSIDLVTNLSGSASVSGSLPYWVTNAPSGDTIQFAANLQGGTITLGKTLDINTNLKIDGAGRSITVNGGGNQVFRIEPGVFADINALTITGGVATGASGGGIMNRGSLSLSNTTVTGNSALDGGGIFNDNTAMMTMTGDTINNNTAMNGSGGGINNIGQLTIINCTIAANHSSGGGGIFNFSGVLLIANSTVAYNSLTGTTADGGGIYTKGPGSQLDLLNTIVFNPNSGAFANNDVRNTIDHAQGDLFGSNVIITSDLGNNKFNLDPLLGPLQNNGGPTATMALLPGSQGIGFGASTSLIPGLTVPTTDQRGDPRPANSIDIGAFEVQAVPFFAVGGAPGHVLVFKPDNTLLADFQPFGAAYTGGVSVAVADVNGDRYDDLIVGATTGNPDVRVYDGKALANGTFKSANPNASLLAEFFAYGLNFNVGANVAGGDIEHTGYADIVTGATAGNPDVHVYRGQDIAQGKFDPSGKSLLAHWFPYALQFNVGANVAVGDVNGDGYADVVTGATAGNPDVRVYSGQDIAKGTFDPAGKSLLAQFFAYGLNFNIGAFVAVGDTTGSGFGDIITGASAGNPDVHIYSGKAIANHTFDNNHPEASLRDQFFAYGLNFNVGAAVASADFENTGKFDILTGASVGSPHYRLVKGAATGVEPPALFEGIPGDLQGGIAVGA